MFDRQKKTPSLVIVSMSQSPSTSQSPLADRPPLPAMTCHLLTSLDASYTSFSKDLQAVIDRVRQLETENSLLSRVVEQHEDVMNKEVTRVKSLYEGEPTSARKLHDDLGKEKAKLQSENGKMKTDLKDLRSKYMRVLSVLVSCLSCCLMINDPKVTHLNTYTCITQRSLSIDLHR